MLIFIILWVRGSQYGCLSQTLILEAKYPGSIISVVGKSTVEIMEPFLVLKKSPI